MIFCFILILSHNNENISKIKNIWINNNYFKNSDFYDFLFIEYNNDIQLDYLIDENTKTLQIKGKDSIIPGCFNKTIRAIEIVKNIYKPNFILRTNISTYFNFDLLEKIINKINNRNKEKIPLCISGPILNLETQNDIKLFIQNLNDLNLINTNDIKNKEMLDKILNEKITKVNISYIHGIFMLLDSNSYDFLINNYDKEKVNLYNDDVLISLAFKKNNYPLISIKNKLELNTNILKNIEINSTYVNNNIYFRCKINTDYSLTYEMINKINNLLNY